MRRRQTRPDKDMGGKVVAKLARYFSTVAKGSTDLFNEKEHVTVTTRRRVVSTQRLPATAPKKGSRGFIS